MSSNLIETLTCPYCGHSLIIMHSRNDVKLIAHCSNDKCMQSKYYEIESPELENLFYKQYYMRNNSIRGWNE